MFLSVMLLFKTGGNMIKNKFAQSTLNTTFDFGTTNDFSIDNTLNTSTQGTNFTFNPSYSCRSKHGYSLTSDQFNNWKRQEEPGHCSRGEIARAYRIRGGY